MLIACVDVGSTFTKAALVDVDGDGLLATSSTVTTAATDVMLGVHDCLDQLAAASAAPEEVRLCSSAGGGLRIAVVGYELAVSAEAGRRIALSAGGRVVHVSSGALDPEGEQALIGARPDVVLLVGGTDGGNAEVLLANAATLSTGLVRAPVVVAGNADAGDEVGALLRAAGRTATVVANVLPSIGTIDPRPARSAIRDLFLSHVIGGKHLSASPDFRTLLRAATPDAVLAGVELLADGAGSIPGAGDVLVVDVGGATTDVYSAVTPDPEAAALKREVVEPLWRQRTVEGDLGMRWGAPGVVAAALAERILDVDGGAALTAPARSRHDDPAFVPDDAREREVDARLAELAVTVALRRHARPVLERDVRVPGVDLREVRLVVGSGGVLRHTDAATAAAILAPVTADVAGGWQRPERADLRVDRRYVLAAAGLLAEDHAEAGAAVLRDNLVRL